MIGSLRGSVLERLDDGRVLVEVGGVGYLVTVTPRTLAELEPTSPVFLYVHYHIREDAQMLFGFLRRDERAALDVLIATRTGSARRWPSPFSVRTRRHARRYRRRQRSRRSCWCRALARRPPTAVDRTAQPPQPAMLDPLSTVSGGTAVGNVRGALRPRLRVRGDSQAMREAARNLRRPRICCAMPFVCWEPDVREEFLDPSTTDDVEEVDEAGLRPRRLSEFVGQGELKEHLSIVLEAAKLRGQPADHLLLAGPPGLGKTSLAGIVAVEMGVQMHITSGPALERAGDLAAILTKLGEGDVLFIDEIHRLSRVVEEILYPAMEDFQLDTSPARARRRRRSGSRYRRSRSSAQPRHRHDHRSVTDRFAVGRRLDYYA
jgi:hypothetical protein